jgi:hypothetical protein
MVRAQVQHRRVLQTPHSAICLYCVEVGSNQLGLLSFTEKKLHPLNNDEH